MTIHLPEDLECSILAALQSGRYASVDDAIIQAVYLLLRQPPAVPSKPLTEQEFEQRLIESGFLARVPPPRGQVAPGWRFEPVKIEGEPLSETITRERR